jgi:hypothetical protein
MTKEVVHHLEMAQDRQSLAGFEELLRQRLKLKSLGLSSLQRSIAHKESRLLWRSEGGAPTRFFHYHGSAQTISTLYRMKAICWLRKSARLK